MRIVEQRQLYEMSSAKKAIKRLSSWNNKIYKRSCKKSLSFGFALSENVLKSQGWVPLDEKQ